MRVFFDIGANRGEATDIALKQGFDKVIALEPAERMYPLLAKNFFHDSRVVPLKFAVSDIPDLDIEFYECGNGLYGQGDGSSTAEISWLTDGISRVTGMDYRVTKAVTCTVDTLVEQYGVPELIKIDVEGGESRVIAGMSCKTERLCFEWHLEYMDKHILDVRKLSEVNGYTEYALQRITHHLLEPEEYRPISEIESIYEWISSTNDAWKTGGWKQAGGYTQDPSVGMIWVRQPFPS